MLRPWVRHIHIRDITLEKDKARDALPGEGELPIASLLDRLESSSFKGPVSLEWELQ
ncbi:MAG: hypothetical protein ACK5LK_07315 [Chthoniobacterales bacterium]